MLGGDTQQSPFRPYIAILNQLQTNRASLIMIKLVLIQPFQQKIYTYITWKNQKLDNELPA